MTKRIVPARAIKSCWVCPYHSDNCDCVHTKVGRKESNDASIPDWCPLEKAEEQDAHH